MSFYLSVSVTLRFKVFSNEFFDSLEILRREEIFEALQIGPLKEFVAFDEFDELCKGGLVSHLLRRWFELDRFRWSLYSPFSSEYEEEG